VGGIRLDRQKGLGCQCICVYAAMGYWCVSAPLFRIAMAAPLFLSCSLPMQLSFNGNHPPLLPYARTLPSPPGGFV
jgi:hypothetical protein